MQTNKQGSLLIDWGNTSLKYLSVKTLAEYTAADQMIDQDSAIDSSVSLIPSTSTRVKGVSELIQALKAQQQQGINFDQAFISSVNSDLNNQQLAQALETLAITTFFAQSGRVFLELTNAYEQPEQLGVDRWLGLIAAREKCKNHTFGLIDMGSAITLDIMDPKGRHLGGHIVPGEAHLVNILEQMGQIQLKQDINSEKERLLGTNTEQCVSLGCQHMVASYLRSLLVDYQNQFNVIQWVITGGGASHWLAKIERGSANSKFSKTFACCDTNHSIIYSPDLIFYGLAQLMCELEAK